MAAKWLRSPFIVHVVREPPAVYTNRLQCEECDRVSREGERGWKAYLTAEEDAPAQAVVYCPECAAREFRERRKPASG